MRRLVTTLLVPDAKGPTIVPTNYGIRLIVDPTVDKGIERAIYLYGTYESGTLDVIRRCLSSGDTFVDVGSNIGLMSLFASRIVGESGVVYAFEPEQDTFAILQQNVSLNTVSNILSYSVALGSVGGEALIYSNLEINRGSASLIKPYEREAAGRKVAVDTLDHFVANHNITQIKMMKIDVEGMELEVLKGATQVLEGPNAEVVSFV